MPVDEPYEPLSTEKRAQVLEMAKDLLTFEEFKAITLAAEKLLATFRCATLEDGHITTEEDEEKSLVALEEALYKGRAAAGVLMVYHDDCITSSPQFKRILKG